MSFLFIASDSIENCVKKGTVIAAHLNAPGSWHDACVAHPIFEKLRTRTPNGYYLVADTAFLRGTAHIAGRIRAPLKAGQRLHGSQEEIQEKMVYDRELLSFRQTAEWGNQHLQGTFGRLRVPLEINNAECRGDLLELCVRLGNLRTRQVGINQIRTVYMPIWHENTEEEYIWKNFEDIIFSEQRRKDRVARFHTYVELK